MAYAKQMFQHFKFTLFKLHFKLNSMIVTKSNGFHNICVCIYKYLYTSKLLSNELKLRIYVTNDLNKIIKIFPYENRISLFIR